MTGGPPTLGYTSSRSARSVVVIGDGPDSPFGVTWKVGSVRHLPELTVLTRTFSVPFGRLLVGRSGVWVLLIL